jgi:hypothetical protein
MTNASAFSNLFNKKIINQLAYSSGLIERKRKVNGLDLIVSVFASVAKQMPSYNVVSCMLYAHQNIDISRQRLHKIISSVKFTIFFKEVINHLWRMQVDPSSEYKKKKFKRVLLQDSTILKLPKKLFGQYSGVSNASTSVTNCRVQLLVDLLTNLLQTLAIDSYSVNDLKARHYLKPQKGDLVIRDRGYFALDQLTNFVKEGVHFIVRPRSSNKYFDRFGKPINLHKVLSKRKTTVLEVRLSCNNGPLLTLFAQKVSPEIAAERARAAKLSSKGRTISKQTMEQLQWSIFLTDLDSKTNAFKDIWKLYSLRWRIEILFKALKTHLHLDSIHNVSNNQLHIIIHARIAIVFLITSCVYNPLQAKIERDNYGKKISLFKLIGILLLDLNLLTNAILYFRKPRGKTENALIPKLLKHASYDSRARKNFQDSLDDIFLS